MRIAKLSAQNLIDTFGDNDFFNVVYVSTYYSVLFLQLGFLKLFGSFLKYTRSIMLRTRIS